MAKKGLTSQLDITEKKQAMEFVKINLSAIFHVETPVFTSMSEKRRFIRQFDDSTILQFDNPTIHLDQKYRTTG